MQLCGCSHRRRRRHSQARTAKACSDRWTDNVWALKRYLVEHAGRAPGEVDAMLGLPDDFDYVP